MLEPVLCIARERAFSLQIHTGSNDNGFSNAIGEYLPYSRRFPDVATDFAHSVPYTDIPAAMAELPRAYVDTAFVSHETVQTWLEAGADEHRIMFGSDLPAPQRYDKIGLSAYVRREIRNFSSPYILSDNAKRFLRGSWESGCSECGERR